MNDIENNYIAMEMPNILFGVKKNATNNTEVTTDNTHTHPFLLPLMLRLAKARPQWKFVAERRSSARVDNRHTLNSFDVYEGGEVLGRIWKSYENRGDVIAINNPRMEEARQRGSATTTSDSKKAFKLVTKNFYGPTISELVKDALGKANNTVAVLMANRRRDFEHKYMYLADFLQEYTLNNWEHMKQAAIDAGVSPANLDGMIEAHEARVATQTIGVTLSNGSGATVVIRGDEYIVVRNGVIAIFDTDHLPPHIKRSIGILKMVADQTYVEGHGARVSKDKFFVSSKEGGVA